MPSQAHHLRDFARVDERSSVCAICRSMKHETGTHDEAMAANARDIARLYQHHSVSPLRHETETARLARLT